MTRISDERLLELAQGYETWGKTASSRPQLNIDVASALRELIALRASAPKQTLDTTDFGPSGYDDPKSFKHY